MRSPASALGWKMCSALHGLDADGHLHVGADCAIAIWQLTPGDAWLARVVGLPPIRPVARIAYDRFADLLYA